MISSRVSWRALGHAKTGFASLKNFSRMLSIVCIYGISKSVSNELISTEHSAPTNGSLMLRRFIP